MSIERIVFWQDMLSIHQAPLIRAMQKVSNIPVVLVTEKPGIGRRENEGWARPDLGDATIIEGLNVADATNLASELGAGSLNIVTGLNSYPALTIVTKVLIESDSIVLVQSERWDPRGPKGALRWLRYLLRTKRVIRTDNVRLLTMGDLGLAAFKSIGIRDYQLFEFGYFTSTTSRTEMHARNGIVYVGSLIERKDVRTLIQAVRRDELVKRLTIIGDGPLRNDLTEQAEGDPRIEFMGSLENSAARDQLARHELLVLPSLFDGWGAVVNEALLSGTPVICSNKVGAKSLLNGPGPFRGLSYRANSVDDLNRAINLTLNQLHDNANLHLEIQEWALASISPEVAARYMLLIATSINKKVDGISPPWQNA